MNVHADDPPAREVRFLPPNARNVVVFVNRTAGSGKRKDRVQTLIARLQAGGFRVTTMTEPEQLAPFSHTLDPALRAIVVAGGDGTVSLVANRTAPGTPIAILPLGTENLVAKYTSAPQTADEVAQQIRQGATISVDAGAANGRMFLLMVGCGFDAEVVRRLHATRQGHIRHASYIKPILDTIRTYQYPKLRILAQTLGRQPAPPNSRPENHGDANSRLLEGRWAFVVNLPRYALGLNSVPTAVGTDGLLDICTFQRGHLASGLRYVWGVLRARHLSWPDVNHCQASAVRIESDEPVPYQLDGDPGGMLPVDIRVLPARLRLVVAPEWARTNGGSRK